MNPKLLQIYVCIYIMRKLMYAPQPSQQSQAASPCPLCLSLTWIHMWARRVLSPGDLILTYKPPTGQVSPGEDVALLRCPPSWPSSGPPSLVHFQPPGNAEGTCLGETGGGRDRGADKEDAVGMYWQADPALVCP